MFIAQGTLIPYRTHFSSSCTWNSVAVTSYRLQIRIFYVYTSDCDFTQKGKWCTIRRSHLNSILKIKTEACDTYWVMNDELCIIFRFRACWQNCEKRLLASWSLSVHLSIRMEQLDSHWTDFNGILYLSIFRKSLDKIPVSLKSDKHNGYFTWRPMYIYDNILINSFYSKNCCRKNL